jgi:hypothetical protein
VQGSRLWISVMLAQGVSSGVRIRNTAILNHTYVVCKHLAISRSGESISTIEKWSSLVPNWIRLRVLWRFEALPNAQPRDQNSLT